MLELRLEKCIYSEQILIQDVLEELLGCRPTEEDFRKCSRILRVGFPDIYCLCYDKIALGNIEIKRSKKHPFIFTTSFTPIPLLN